IQHFIVESNEFGAVPFLDLGQFGIDTISLGECTRHMASRRVEASIRITGGLLVIVLAVTSLIMIWSQSPKAFTGIAISLAAGIVISSGAIIVVGRTRAGRIVLTRHRWKYGLLIGVIVVYTVMTVVLNRPVGNPGLAIFPIVLGLFVAQLFESEAVAASKAALIILTDRNVRSWTRIVRVMAVAGVVLCSISVVAAVVGNFVLVSLVLPVAIISLLLAGAIWVWLRSVRRQAKANR
ncbi:hypothetical protein, partial [Arthrobacter sp. lap29]|uniref:hypothetical protein n=1 Tax=Arthrobacter sp. lap29 TaxID=3056122 RepID=UPI0028F7067B